MPPPPLTLSPPCAAVSFTSVSPSPLPALSSHRSYPPITALCTTSNALLVPSYLPPDSPLVSHTATRRPCPPVPSPLYTSALHPASTWLPVSLASFGHTPPVRHRAVAHWPPSPFLLVPPHFSLCTLGLLFPLLGLSFFLASSGLIHPLLTPSALPCLRRSLHHSLANCGTPFMCATATDLPFLPPFLPCLHFLRFPLPWAYAMLLLAHSPPRHYPPHDYRGEPLEDCPSPILYRISTLVPSLVAPSAPSSPLPSPSQTSRHYPRHYTAPHATACLSPPQSPPPSSSKTPGRSLAIPARLPLLLSATA